MCNTLSINFTPSNELSRRQGRFLSVSAVTSGCGAAVRNVRQRTSIAVPFSTRTLTNPASCDSGRDGASSKQADWRVEMPVAATGWSREVRRFFLFLSRHSIVNFIYSSGLTSTEQLADLNFLILFYSSTQTKCCMISLRGCVFD